VKFSPGLLVLGMLLASSQAGAQGRQDPGRSIGTVSTSGDLIVVTLDRDALGKANLFDLGKRTLRFTPKGGGYRVENLPLQWDSDFGAEMSGAQAELHRFAFPFSGKNWESFSVGIAGSIRFGPEARGPGGAGRGGGVSIGRFDPLQEAAHRLVDTVPAICVFFKPRMSGHRYLKELEDRAVITWDLTEPYGNIQDFTWTPTVNRFQAVLGRDGSIEMSYEQLAARDAIVGVYPVGAGRNEEQLGTFTDQNSGIRNLRVSTDGVSVKVAIETSRLADDNPDTDHSQYRIYFDLQPPRSARALARSASVVWTITTSNTRRLFASGAGVNPPVKVEGNTLSIEGILPAGFNSASEFSVWAESAAGVVAPHVVKRTGVLSAEAHLSTLKPADGPFPVIYEAFHYLALPNPRDLTCTVIKALGDKFDFLAYYSDFRVDNQEAGTPSNGPRGGNVTGIGAVQRGSESYCSAGRFQWQFVQPVYSGSIQMQDQPPEGITSAVPRDIAFYRSQLGERSADGKMLPYNYGISQIAHEMGHRWSAFVSAKVGNETVQLGPTHWARGLQAPVAFPYQRPTEASAMGGGVWQDNLDGTFTQLDDDYYVPATGWSYLDLYLMGLISAAEVPDFFLLKNLVPAGADANGHPKFKAERVKVSIDDVIAAEGARVPAVEKSQRQFNTGMVVMVVNGAKPSRELIERSNGIRKQWIEYWSITSGRRSSMTTNPR
jgi:hypothetical protein